MSERVEKFTPGPWSVKINHDWEEVAVLGVSPVQYGELYIATMGQVDTAVSDATLIAASPDMYAALKAVMQIPHFHFDCKDPACSHEDCEVTRMVVSALAKARGEAV